MSDPRMKGHLALQWPFDAASTDALESGRLEPKRAVALTKIIEKSSNVAEAGQPLKDSVAPAWRAEFFSLHRSTLFQSLSEAKKESVLRLCSDGLLYESQMIELAGTTFAAKMALLSETIEQRELYSFFAADEARHLRLISKINGSPRSDRADDNLFLRYLGGLILSEPKIPLVLLIQVVLEGWGISHYTKLAEHSGHPEITEVFKEILKDEARHHGSGLVLFSEDDLSADDERRLIAQLSEFLTMVRSGPFSVVQALAAQAGGMSIEQVTEFLRETDFSAKLGSDLALLNHLLLKAGASRIASALSSEGLFEVPTLEQCSAVIASGLGIVA